MRLFHLRSTVKIRPFSPFPAGGPTAVAACWPSLWNVEKVSAISHGLILSNPGVFRFLLDWGGTSENGCLPRWRGVRFFAGGGAVRPRPFRGAGIGSSQGAGGTQRSLFFSYCGPMTFIYSTAEKNSMIRPRMNAWSKLDISAMSPPRSTAAPMPTSHAMR